MLRMAAQRMITRLYGLHEENKRYTIYVGVGQMETIITEEMILDDLLQTFHRFFGLKVYESTPIKRGWLNLKWKVTTDSGTFLIKQYNKRRYKMYNPEDLSFACAQQVRLYYQGLACPRFAQIKWGGCRNAEYAA